MEINLKVIDLDYYINGSLILSNVNMEVYKGDRICIIGKNGSGKTTLLKVLSGLASSSAKLHFKGEELENLKCYKKKLAYIPDTPYLYEYLTGAENITLIMSLWGIKNKTDYLNKLEELIYLFNLDIKLKDYIYEYSLGMRQKLFFAMMLARDTEIMILDEPFTGFDKDSLNVALELLLKYSEEGKSIIFVSHLKEIQDRLSSKTYKLINGKLESSL